MMGRMADVDRGFSGPPLVVQPHTGRSVPVYVLFLIMVGSGIFTLFFLWICVQYIYHRRRVMQSWGDVDRISAAERAWDAEGVERTERDRVISRQETRAPDEVIVGPDSLNLESGRSNNNNQREANGDLTYVVMAGEDKPTFLAFPLSSSRGLPSTQFFDHMKPATNIEK